MGNWLPSFSAYPSDEDLDYYANEEKKQTEKTLKNDVSDDQVLRDCKDVDLVNILHFLEKNLNKDDADVKDLKHMIADVLKKHLTTQCKPVYQALQKALNSHGQYTDMLNAIKGLVADEKIAIIQETQSHNASTKTEFSANVEAMSGLITNVLAACGAGPVGPILSALLHSLKRVNFWSEDCGTEGHKNQTLGIIDIVWDDERNGTVLFEIAKLEVNLANKEGHYVFIGSKKVFVDIRMYYAQASMELQDFMTPQQLNKLKANTSGKGFKLGG